MQAITKDRRFKPSGERATLPSTESLNSVWTEFTGALRLPTDLEDHYGDNDECSRSVQHPAGAATSFESLKRITEPEQSAGWPSPQGYGAQAAGRLSAVAQIANVEAPAWR